MTQFAILAPRAGNPAFALGEIAVICVRDSPNSTHGIVLTKPGRTVPSGKCSGSVQDVSQAGHTQSVNVQKSSFQRSLKRLFQWLYQDFTFVPEEAIACKIHRSFLSKAVLYNLLSLHRFIVEADF